MGPKPKSVSERFWPKVQKTDHCWLWTANRNSAGYGLVFDGSRKVLAHRQSWVLAFGDIPENMRVLHRCDTPLCVRPDHLMLGTQRDNMQDMACKDRSSNQYAKAHILTNEEVRKLRQDYASGTKSQHQLAAHYCVSQTSVSQLVNGVDRIDAGGPIYKGPRRFVRKLTVQEVRTLRERYARGDVTQQELANELGVSKSCVNFAISGRNWKTLDADS